MTSDRLKIAYLCDISPLDRNPYSGGNTRIFEALKKHAGDVTILSNTWHVAEPLRRLIHASPERINLRARWRTHLLLSRIVASGVRRELANGQYDVLFGAYSFQSMHRVVPPYPMVKVFTSDATHTTYRNSEIGNFHKSSKAGRMLDAWVERCENRTFHAADLLLWPSSWMKQLADARYGLSDQNSHWVPWGANLMAPPPHVTPTELSRSRPVRLLLIGRNWFAKGGPIAFDTMQMLRARGIDARLTVIGSTPPDFHRNEFVTVHHHLDKADPAQFAVFEQALATAHFVVMPSYESYGFVFCEASAYGVPSLCLRVGGVPIRDGVNGHALPIGSGPAEYSAMIERYLDAPESYRDLCVSTRREFDERLNWDAWGKHTAALLQQAVARKRQH